MGCANLTGKIVIIAGAERAFRSKIAQIQEGGLDPSGMFRVSFKSSLVVCGGTGGSKTS